jgi:hypothetical protein
LWFSFIDSAAVPQQDTSLNELFNYTPALDAMCVQVDSHPGGLKQLAGKYGVFGHITIKRLQKAESPTQALLEGKYGLAKHTIEELAGFLVDLGMETTARKAMVEKLCAIDVSDSPHLAPLRACGELLSKQS